MQGFLSNHMEHFSRLMIGHFRSQKDFNQLWIGGNRMLYSHSNICVQQWLEMQPIGSRVGVRIVLIYSGWRGWRLFSLRYSMSVLWQLHFHSHGFETQFSSVTTRLEMQFLLPFPFFPEYSNTLGFG